MKTPPRIPAFLLALAAAAPALRAHEGHGSLSADSAAHYLLEPVHLPGLALAVLGGWFAWRFLRRVPRTRRGPQAGS